MLAGRICANDVKVPRASKVHMAGAGWKNQTVSRRHIHLLTARTADHQAWRSLRQFREPHARLSDNDGSRRYHCARCLPIHFGRTDARTRPACLQSGRPCDRPRLEVPCCSAPSPRVQALSGSFASTRPRSARLGATCLFRMLAFSELLDDLRAECWEILRAAAGHKTLIDDNFLIDPRAASVFDILPD
jgi:hypothetical protein